MTATATEVRVFLGGEGRNELGSRSGDRVHQTDNEPGVIQALLRRIQSDGWIVCGATNWSRIRKLTARGPSPAEHRNVEALILDAKESDASIAAFVRDADDDNSRPATIRTAIESAREKFPAVTVVGGCSIPVLEAWILAMRGKTKTEMLRKSAAQTQLEADGIKRKDTQAMVQVVETCDLGKLPNDAHSLQSWLKDADALRELATASG